MTSILAESLGILWSGGRGKQKNKNKEQNGGDKWEIVYWGGGAFRGRAELVKLVFAAADVKYTMQGDGIPEIIAAYPKEPTPVATILAKTPKHFAPPILRNTATGFELSQTPAILEYLGEKFGLVPHSLEDKARARQVALSACDFLADGRAPFHPVKPTESYAIQKDEAAVAVAEFTAEGGRLDRWLAHFATLVDNKPRYLFGDTITYADCALFHVLDAAMSQFPDAWDEPSREKLRATLEQAHEAHHDARDARRLPQGRRPRALGRRLDDVQYRHGPISTPPSSSSDAASSSTRARPSARGPDTGGTDGHHA